MKERRINGQVGDAVSEHGRHVRLDHTGAFGHGSEGVGFAADALREVTDLDGAVGGGDSLGRGAETLGREGTDSSGDAGFDLLHRQGNADFAGA